MTASDNPLTLYAAIVKDELSSRLGPALESAQNQQVAQCGQRVLAHVVTTLRERPQLEAAALSAYRKLVDELRSVLRAPAEANAVEVLARQLDEAAAFHDIEGSIQTLAAQLSALDGPKAQASLSRLTAISADLRRGLMRAQSEAMAHSAVKPEDGAAFSAEQSGQLAQWLRAEFPGNDALRIVGLKLIPGGFSKQTVFVTLEHARTLPATVVIRLDWSQSAVGTTVVDEFSIIKTLFDAGIRVPQPYALEASGRVLGGPFLVVSKAEGRNIGDYLDVQGGSVAFAKDLAATLAQLHAVPVAAFGDQVAGANEGVRERLLREIAGFETSWRGMGIASVELEIAFAWLKRHIDRADGPRSLIHKDVGCHNLLVDQDRLSVLLDWETAAIGTAAQDLGYLYPSIAQFCEWPVFLAAYAEAGGSVPGAEQIGWYTLWGYTWLNVMLLQARGAFLSGAAPDIRLAYAGAYFTPRLQERLAEQLASMLRASS